MVVRLGGGLGACPQRSGAPFGGAASDVGREAVLLGVRCSYAARAESRAREWDQKGGLLACSKRPLLGRRPKAELHRDDSRIEATHAAGRPISSRRNTSRGVRLSRA